MQLKRLQLTGFKTFADRTEFEIDAGLTAIVGPNGSGKSNIVDGLLWVLGEQNPRMLRGTGTQDVIFAGTSKRRRTGMAEVRLTVDNTDGSLPIDFAEVVIARRLYRSGESRYMLNGASCRLRDIVDLFLDSGAGHGAYAFVGQSEVDAVLSARPEDRRELFEEAAGIKKYRARKREALRKLDLAEANLLRVDDILAELSTRVEPLRLQAERAQLHGTLASELRDIEVEMLASELADADYDLVANRDARATDTEDLLELDTAIARHEAAVGQTTRDIAALDDRLEAAAETLRSVAARLADARSEAALLKERSASSNAGRAALERDLAECSERIAHLGRRADGVRSERDGAREAAAVAEAQLGAARSALAECEAAVADALARAEQARAEQARSAEERASLRVAAASAAERATAAHTRSVEADAAAAAAADAAAELRAAAEAAARLYEEADARASGAGTDSAAATAALDTARATLEQTTAARDDARRTLAERTARLGALRDLHASHEGYYQGVRALLGAVGSGALQGTFRPVVDLLSVGEPFRLAIEVALGGALQDVATATEAEAREGVEWLKRNRAGRVTFLPLPLLRPAPDAAAWQGPLLVSADQIDRPVPAAAVASVEAGFEAVLSVLLGRVYVVRDMDAAIRAARSLRGWSRLVTLEGEVLTPTGALTGGSLQGRATHILGRKTEIDDLEAALPGLEAGLADAAAAATAAATAVERAAESAASSASAAAAARADAAAARRDAVAASLAADSAQAGRRRLSDTAAAARADVERLDEQAAAATRAAGSAPAAGVEPAHLEALDRTARELASLRDARRSSAVTLEVEAGRHSAAATALERELAQIEQEARETAARSVRVTAALTDSDRTAGETARRMEEVAAAAAGLSREHDEAEAHWAALRAERAALAALAAEAGAQRGAFQEQRGEITARLHAAEVAVARLEVRADQAAARLAEEYGIDRDEALRIAGAGAPDRATIGNVHRLRRELRALGPVNPAAIEEYAETAERVHTLAEQRSDLERSREQLLETTAEIDERTREVFLSTFEAVQEAFEGLFTRLFGGGAVSLSLTNPGDLMETGIDITVAPPGKKAQGLSLLSGGERALTAIALLFAFLSVRPSPFVILDEVDAPLDGANVEKFAELLRDFSLRSQMLIVTHNPVTMESAPRWYGVTMREQGVTSVLNYRVPEASVVEQTPDLTMAEPAVAVVAART